MFSEWSPKDEQQLPLVMSVHGVAMPDDVGVMFCYNISYEIYEISLVLKRFT